MKYIAVLGLGIKILVTKFYHQWEVNQRQKKRLQDQRKSSSKGGQNETKSSFRQSMIGSLSGIYIFYKKKNEMNER